MLPSSTNAIARLEPIGFLLLHFIIFKNKFLYILLNKIKIIKKKTLFKLPIAKYIENVKSKINLSELMLYNNVYANIGKRKIMKKKSIDISDLAR